MVEGISKNTLIRIILKKECPEASYFKLNKTTFMKIFKNQESIQFNILNCHKVEQQNCRVKSRHVDNVRSNPALAVFSTLSQAFFFNVLLLDVCSKMKKTIIIYSSKPNCKNVAYFFYVVNRIYIIFTISKCMHFSYLF